MGGHYFATAAGAAGVFAADFFTAFLCFFAVFAVVVAAGLLAPFEAGAGAGVCADIKAMLPKARAIVITVVFILFSLRAFFLSPAHNPILRRIDPELDSLRKLQTLTNSRAPR
jgi:hypothetical protein